MKNSNKLLLVSNTCWVAPIMIRIVFYYFAIKYILFASQVILNVNQIIEFATVELLLIIVALVVLFVLDSLCSKKVIGEVALSDESIKINYCSNKSECLFKIKEICAFEYFVGAYEGYVVYGSVIPSFGKNSFLSFDAGGRTYNYRVYLRDDKEKEEFKDSCKDIYREVGRNAIRTFVYEHITTRLFHPC